MKCALPFRVMGLLTAALAVCPAGQAVDLYEPFNVGSHVVLRNGRALFLECTPPGGQKTEEYFAQWLASPSEWETYAGKGRVGIPFHKLAPQVQRDVLLTLFRFDYVTDKGWHHRVRCGGPGSGRETLWTLSEWLTGNGFNSKSVMQTNGLRSDKLDKGQTVLVPYELLREPMREPTPDRVPPPLELEPRDELIDVKPNGSPLTFGEDAQGRYAMYRLQPGDASIYTPVVVRFTDYRENTDILSACKAILDRSGIHDVTDMETGQPIKIPIEMLSAQFLPKGDPQRVEFDETLEEAERLRSAERVEARNLAGVVVILDPGHGGKDTGADMRRNRVALLEDEINYDICCRILKKLQAETGAKVHMTMRDRSQGWGPVSTTRFVHDQDEEVLTTPPYPNLNAKLSANLRWYLANDIYRRAVAASVHPRKVVFTSFHCDALYNESLRGAMIYVPGARYRRDSERPGADSFYNQFAEARGHRTATSTASQRKQDEALSRLFAETLLEELGRHRVKRHDKSAPIRNVIRQSGGRYYVPAVLRNNAVPTKVLVEVANMTNATDQTRMADPEWRQMVADAYVSALKRHFAE